MQKNICETNFKGSLGRRRQKKGFLVASLIRLSSDLVLPGSALKASPKDITLAHSVLLAEDARILNNKVSSFSYESTTITSVKVMKVKRLMS